MKYNQINKNNNKKFILFVNGWGMDESVVKHLNPESFDILAISDYRKFDNELYNIDLSCYKEKYLVAWSMGVYVSALYSNILKDFNKKIALAGTQKIIDDNFGIPRKIYNITIKLFNEESAQKFINSIFLDKKKNFHISKDTNELKEELISLKNLTINSELNYDKAIIPMKDKIIPYDNQINYWSQKNVQTVEINSPHYVFDNYKSWQEIIC